MFRRIPLVGVASILTATALTLMILDSAGGEEIPAGSTTSTSTAVSTTAILTPDPVVTTSSTAPPPAGPTTENQDSENQGAETSTTVTSTTEATTTEASTTEASTTEATTTEASTTEASTSTSTSAPTTTTTTEAEPTTTTEAEPTTVRISGRAGLDVGGELKHGPNLLRVNFVNQDTDERVLTLVYTGDALTGFFEGELPANATYRAEVTICCNIPTVKLIYPDLTFTGDTDLDFTVPAVEVVFEVHDSLDEGVADATIVVPLATGSSDGVTWTARVYADPTDENGETRVVLPVGTSSDPDSRPSIVLSDGTKDTFAFTELVGATAESNVPTVTQPDPDSVTSGTTEPETTTSDTTIPGTTISVATTISESTSTPESTTTTNIAPESTTTTVTPTTEAPTTTVTPTTEPTTTELTTTTTPSVTVGATLTTTTTANSPAALEVDSSTTAEPATTEPATTELTTTELPTTELPTTSTTAQTTLLPTTVPTSTSTTEHGPSPITTAAAPTSTTAPEATPPQTTTETTSSEPGADTTTPDTTTPSTTSPSTVTGPEESASDSTVPTDSTVLTTTTVASGSTPSSAPPPAGPVVPAPSGDNTVRIRIPAPVGIEVSGQAGVVVLGETAPGSHSLRVNFHRVDNDELAARVTFTGDNNNGKYSATLLAGVLYRAEVIVCCEGPTLQLNFEDLIFSESSTQDLLVPAAEVLIKVVDEDDNRVFNAEVNFKNLQGSTSEQIAWSATGSPEDRTDDDSDYVNEFPIVLPVGLIDTDAAVTDLPASITINEEDPVGFEVPDIVFNANTITIVVASDELSTESELAVTRPWITPTLSVTKNDAGWINEDAEITWEVSDPAPAVGLPDIDLAPTPVAVQGTKTYWSDEACDDEDNCTKGSLEVMLDSVAPSVVVLGFVDGTIRFAEPVPRCSASDTTSKLEDECVLETTVTLSEFDAESDEYTTTYTVTATANDNAGNITVSQKTYRLVSDEEVPLTETESEEDTESEEETETEEGTDSATDSDAEDETTTVSTPTTATTGPATTIATTTIPTSSTPAVSASSTTTSTTTTVESLTTTVPETTVPETTVPETTVPETTVPETTVPETTVPEATAPATTVPGTTTVPETTPASTGVVDPGSTTAEAPVAS